jgi:uncharacterized protein (DUF1778 family)
MSEDRTRSRKIVVEVTPEQGKAIEAAAEAEGLPTSTYMRRVAVLAARQQVVAA